MGPTADRWEAFRKAASALGETNRLRIVRVLLSGPSTVSELTYALALRQPLVSHHLSVLSEAGVVEVRKAGRRHYYSLSPEGDDRAGDLVALVSQIETVARAGVEPDAARSPDVHETVPEAADGAPVDSAAEGTAIEDRSSVDVGLLGGEEIEDFLL